MGDINYMEMLGKINDNLASFKDDMRSEIHAINLSIVAIQSDIKSLNDKLEPRIERLEAGHSLHDHVLMIMKDEIKSAQMSLIKVEEHPGEIKTIKHRIGNSEQHIAILQEINNIEDHEQFSERLAQAEVDITLLKEKTKHVEANKAVLDSQKAVWKFVQTKPVWTLLVFGGVIIAAYYGIEIK